jgi:hypothetical protein
MIPILIALILSCIALWRADFSIDQIAAPLEGENLGDMPPCAQEYHYLGHGRQAIVFAGDGLVLKFFNRHYFEVPWYLSWKSQESLKRSQRRKFFCESYALAGKFWKEETGIVYLHLGKTQHLPSVRLVDKAHRVLMVDLNQVPFVIQKRGEPLYPALQKIRQEQGEAAFQEMIAMFFQMIEDRLSLGIGDKDHDVEHNFGYVDGKILHLDPGRFFLFDPEDLEALAHERWSSTHALAKWLKGSDDQREETISYKRNPQEDNTY